MSPLRRILGVLGAAVATTALAFTASPPIAAHAACSVVVTPQPSTEGETVVTLEGSGFQYVPNAPDGIYIMFGVVSDPTSNSWAPSQGGQGGITYSYAGTDGAIVLLGFEGADGAAEKSGVIDANGNWSVELTIPGPEFVVSAGRPAEGEEADGDVVNCLVDTCGVITIGAMGKINANNETFTPVTFVDPEPEPAPEPEPTEATPEPETAAEPEATPEAVADAPSQSSISPWLVAGGAAVLIVAAAGTILAIRKSKARNTGDES